MRYDSCNTEVWIHLETAPIHSFTKSRELSVGIMATLCFFNITPDVISNLSSVCISFVNTSSTGLSTSAEVQWSRAQVPEVTQSPKSATNSLNMAWAVHEFGISRRQLRPTWCARTSIWNQKKYDSISITMSYMRHWSLCTICVLGRYIDTCHPPHASTGQEVQSRWPDDTWNQGIRHGTWIDRNILNVVRDVLIV